MLHPCSYTGPLGKSVLSIKSNLIIYICNTFTPQIKGIHKPCIPHSTDSRATTKCELVYIQMQPGKVVHIKHAQHFELRLKSLILIDYNYRPLYRHPNSRSIVGFNLSLFQVLTEAHTSLSNRFIDYLRGELHACYK